MRKPKANVPRGQQPGHTQQQLQDRYMQDLNRLFPEEDGRRLRGIANRLAKAADIVEREEILVLEFGVEPRYARTPAGSVEVREMASERGRRGQNLQRDSVPTQGEN